MGDTPYSTPEGWARLFAEYLDGLVDDAAQEEKEVCVPVSLQTAMLSLLEYLLEDAPEQPSLLKLPSPLNAVAVRLARAIATRGEEASR